MNSFSFCYLFCRVCVQNVNVIDLMVFHSKLHRNNHPHWCQRRPLYSNSRQQLRRQRQPLHRHQHHRVQHHHRYQPDLQHHMQPSLVWIHRKLYPFKLRKCENFDSVETMSKTINTHCQFLGCLRCPIQQHPNRVYWKFKCLHLHYKKTNYIVH